ncbi:cupin domain-containing protein [Pseudomonas vanderleydeniana]|uniref:Cupin domain-containing protein n=1 Tax=Pseudomonas vanderleydeniana TaxID=2745495 RepID=A0A9E6PQK5_9PSED|nr:cupin domain-containing protein [Pseudomonas vanderleydeniana]QXI30950.1 cupin domain-containing protein [Pseudomonas vanderleydeniana]
MTPIVTRLAANTAFSLSTPVAQPLGEPISQTRTAASQALENPNVAFGIWECTPGTWRRQVLQAEYSYFISGQGIFTPDEGEAVQFQAGDAIYFAPKTTGVWDIRETVTKHYFIVG